MSDGAIVANLRKYSLKDNVDLLVIDEISMTSAEFLVLLDSRLRFIYDSSNLFGRKHVVLSGDFCKWRLLVEHLYAMQYV